MSPDKTAEAGGNRVPGHTKGSPFAEGPLIAKAADLGTFALLRENAGLLRRLNKRLKLFRGEDGWFARLVQLLKLRIRGGPPANAFDSGRGPEHRSRKISGESERTGFLPRTGVAEGQEAAK